MAMLIPTGFEAWTFVPHQAAHAYTFVCIYLYIYTCLWRGYWNISVADPRILIILLLFHSCVYLIYDVNIHECSKLKYIGYEIKTKDICRFTASDHLCYCLSTKFYGRKLLHALDLRLYGGICRYFCCQISILFFFHLSHRVCSICNSVGIWCFAVVTLIVFREIAN